MAILIDLESRSFAASVSDLAGESGERAIGLNGSGLSRLWIGQELHRRVQQELTALEPGYQAEVPVRLETVIDDWRVTVVGRADGVVRGGDGVIRVDEIKTLHFAVDLHNLYASERLDRFRRQLSLYAAVLSGDGPPSAARLVLVDIVTFEERDEEVVWDRDSVDAWLRQTVRRLIAIEQRRLERLDRLRAEASDLPFPHAQPRPAQLPMGAAVDTALGEQRHLLLAAPTGAGKTAAALHAALRRALLDGHRLFYLTAKTLQQRLAVETVRSMQRGGFRSLQLRAKGKMCANSEMVCHEEFCPYAREYGIKLIRSQLLPTLLDSGSHLDPDRIFDAARQHEVCPFEVSLDLLPDVDVVICDYNYVFDPIIGLASLLGGGALQRAVLVVDEAHNLVERGREYYSPILSAAALEAALAVLGNRDNALFRRLSEVITALAELVEGTVRNALDERRDCETPVELPRHELTEIRIELDGAMLQYFLYKRENELWSADDPVLDVFFQLTHFHRVLGLGGEEFVHLAARTASGEARLRIVCLDASRFLGAVLEASGGCVAMSATLEPFEFYRDLLGFDRRRTDTLAVPSPFPPENRLVLAIDDVDTTWRRRLEHADAIAGWISRLAEPGRNALVLFPSYAFLETVLDRLPPVPHEILVQQRGASDAEQRELLDRLSSGRSQLVLAVLGGIFAEGVDYPGDMLSQVMVVSPGLPQYNLERELLKAYYAERYGRGFEYAYLVPGLTRVVQAAGRLIRSASDRGTIVLLCRRFLDRRYAALLPDDWLEDDAASLLRPDPIAAVRAFFAVPTGLGGRMPAEDPCADS